MRLTTLLPAQLVVLALAGCESPGFSARETELARQRGEVGFAVLESGEERAVFAANGQQIAVEPPEGYCLDEESLAVTRRSAFALVADCMEREQQALANGTNGEDLPRAFPGILTVTVSGEAAFGDQPGALASFETLLGTRGGARLLGRGDGTTSGQIVTAERVDGALYVLVEESPAEGSESIFAPRFWRAFTEISGRLVLVTVSGFNDRPLGEEEMLAFLASQVAALRAANAMPASVDERQVAARVLDQQRMESAAEAVGEGGGQGSGQQSGERVRRSPLIAPEAPRRPG